MANLTTVHHVDIKLGEVISINCPICKCNQMVQNKYWLAYWTCGNGHEFYVSLYESSAKTLNLRLVFDNEGDK
jgi:hypothetical protein